MLQQPWWVCLGFIVGLVAPGFMIFYWVYRWKAEMAEKGWRYTSYSTLFMWILIFFSSLYGILRILESIKIGSVVDVMLLYANAILYYIGLAVLVTAVIVDLLSKVRRKA